MKTRKTSMFKKIKKHLFAPAPYDSENDHIIINGQNIISIDQTVSIVEYDHSIVRLQLKKTKLEILGDELKIDAFSDKNICVSGNLQSISFVK